MRLPTLAALSGAVLFAAPATAQDFDAVEIEAVVVAPGIAMLDGMGGNIGVSYGEDGTILIDDQFAPLSDKIEQAVNDLGAKPVEYVINTHWHFDHAGGNPPFAEAGAKIVAHRAVRERLARGESRDGRRPVEPLTGNALPVVTFEQGLTLHRNGDTIDVLFLGGGHTDGDAIVRWREKNVIHMGDLFFNTGGFPYVDLGSGGSVAQAMASIDIALTLMDAETIVMPGHGPVSDRAGLIAVRTRMGEAVRRVRAAKETGMSLDEALAARLIAGMGYAQTDFMDDEKAVRSIWASL